MSPVSVVIIACNEENNIADCILSAKKISNDIIVVDCGSNDKTVARANQCGARSFVIEWNGYGHSRNFGAMRAANDWILALDADERVSEELAESINQIRFTDGDCIYKFKRENYLSKKKIRFGTLGFETVKRIYNRHCCKWDLTLVHEKLIGKNIIQKEIEGIDLCFPKKERMLFSSALLSRWEIYRKRIILLTALALALLTGTVAVTAFPATQAMADPGGGCGSSGC